MPKCRAYKNLFKRNLAKRGKRNSYEYSITQMSATRFIYKSRPNENYRILKKCPWRSLDLTCFMGVFIERGPFTEEVLFTSYSYKNVNNKTNTAIDFDFCFRNDI